jgi:hypothetical protein
MIDDPLWAFLDPESYSEPSRLTLILAVNYRINFDVAKTVVAIKSTNGLLVLAQKCFTVAPMPDTEGRRRGKHALPNRIGIEIFIPAIDTCASLKRCPREITYSIVWVPSVAG